MEEEQEMERFDMDGDFEGAEFIDGEFYYRNRKKKRLQTKEEALYGYDSASDSEREERRRRKKRNGLIDEKDLSKPMNFVSAAGPKIGSEIPENGASTSKSGEETSDSRGGLGFGSGAGLGGLGFNSSSDQSAAPGFGLGFNAGSGLGFKPGESDSKGGGEDDEPVLDTPLGRKIQENARKKAAPAKAKSSSGKSSYNWESHGNSKVSRMMEKMGWKAGTGLGKNEEGRTTAIETRTRPKNMGLGFGDFVEAGSKKEEEEKDEAPSQLQKPKANEKMWKKKNRSKVKEYITAEELLRREQEKGGGQRVVEKVLDMTRKQMRVVTDMKNLISEPEPEPEVVEDDPPMRELQHNVRVLVDLVESDLRDYDSKLRHEKQTVVILRKDRDRLEKQLDLQSKSLEIIQEITATINEVSLRRLSMEGVANVFRKLKLEHPEEYKAWNLSAIALARALPLVSPRFQGWQPLVQPSRGIETLLLWREVFQEDDEPIFVEVDNSPFTRLVMEAVMPHIRRAVTNWEVRDPEPMLGFLGLWEKLLPTAILHSVLDHLVMPKLNSEIEAWNPLVDTIPVHVWVHPWLPVLGSRLDPICGVIRMRLDSVLGAWHPRDSSAYMMLSPWYPVFDSASWDQLLLRKIIPKLYLTLDHELRINPAQQDLAPFNWVISWSPVMPAHLMIKMLEERFFPRWLRVLLEWLRSYNPDFEEVARWYEGWKSIIPEELLASDRVRRQINGALKLMELAVDGKVAEMEGVLLQLQQQQFVDGPPARYHHPILQKQQEQRLGGDGVELASLKDLLEEFAVENEVRFLPKVGRMHQGFQVYGFGKVSVSVDNHKQVILAQSGEKWSSVSMGDLLEMHRARSRGS